MWTISVSGGNRRSGLGAELLQADSFSEFKEQAERAYLLQKLREHDWNVSETARSRGYASVQPL